MGAYIWRFGGGGRARAAGATWAWLGGSEAEAEEEAAAAAKAEAWAPAAASGAWESCWSCVKRRSSSQDFTSWVPSAGPCWKSPLRPRSPFKRISSADFTKRKEKAQNKHVAP
jgi:hypothetical protein